MYVNDGLKVLFFLFLQATVSREKMSVERFIILLRRFLILRFCAVK
jgi:hypothetical protein